MDKRKIYMSVLAGILAFAMVLGLVAGFLPTKADAASSSELKAQLNALQDQNANLEAQIADLHNQISENSSEIERMVDEKNIIDQEIFLLYRQIENINNQVATYSMLIADKQDELTAAEVAFAELMEKNKERIQAMEEEGEVTYWSVLFQANSFADLLDRINMVQEIAASDRRRLDELNAAAKAVAEAKAVLEEEKLGLEETKITLNATQQELEVKREEANELLTELVDRGMEYEMLVHISEEAQAQLMLDMAVIEEEYDKALYREWLATSVPPTTKPPRPSQTRPTKPAEPEVTTPSDDENTDSEETLPDEDEEEEDDEDDEYEDDDYDDEEDYEDDDWDDGDYDEGWIVPMSYICVTSPYGWREHPIYGGSAFHYGVDLAANEGTPIYAARSGVVSAATYNSSAGYFVQIDHDQGYRTIYMHMTYFVVDSGEYVSQGELIGYCGSTGDSTGPHLHFGLSQYGSYDNPAYYIPI